jgi:hypothetical protein
MRVSCTAVGMHTPRSSTDASDEPRLRGLQRDLLLREHKPQAGITDRDRGRGRTNYPGSPCMVCLTDMLVLGIGVASRHSRRGHRGGLLIRTPSRADPVRTPMCVPALARLLAGRARAGGEDHSATNDLSQRRERVPISPGRAGQRVRAPGRVRVAATETARCIDRERLSRRPATALQ